jgi:uncharacterized repeat protein (TIGR03803 family)
LSLYKFLIPVFAAGILIAPEAIATSFETLYKFTGKTDGAGVYGSFAVDPSGVLYGITSEGGNFDNVHCGDGCGTIFGLTPASGKFASLHKFTEAEGISLNSPLTAGGGKIFYGAAGFGGPGVKGGGGSIFKFDASNRAVTVLYTLRGDNNTLTAPSTSVTLAKGGLYGSAIFGGPGDGGGIYRLDLTTKALKVVYAFGGGSAAKTVGFRMNIGMVLGKDGMVYGTTIGGGPKGAGAIFRIDPTTQKITALHAVDDGSGGIASGALTVASNGLLYGTTAQGSTAKHNCGGTGCGALFKFDPKTLKFTILHSFTGGADGGFPEGSTAIGGIGEALYGLTGFGGAHKQGALYRINLATNKLTVLYNFTGGAGGGIEENSLPSLTFRGGKFFGVATMGGDPKACSNQGCGTIFALTP